MKTVKTLSVLAMALVALAGCDEYEVSERWRIRPIAGRTLRAGFCGADWIQFRWKESPDLPIFREKMLPHFTLLKNNHLTDYHKYATPKLVWTNATYSIEDLLSRDVTSAIARLERDLPGVPYLLTPWDGDFRSIFSHPMAEPDVDGFRKWRAAHPSFMGFRSICEHDGAMASYFRGQHYRNYPKFQEEIDREFPHTTTGYVAQLAVCEKGIAKQRHKLFDCEDHVDLFSIQPTWAQVCGRSGSRLITFEADLCTVSAGWSEGAWFARGAARQWGVPWCWYQASYVASSDRNGKPYCLMNEVKRKWYEHYTPLCGASFSLLSRGWHYGWFAGASVLQPENYASYFVQDGPKGPSTEPTKYCLEFNSVFELDDKVDRGVPYTPCAYLTSIEEPFCRSGAASGRDTLSQNAFFWTLVPTPTENVFNYRQNRNEGCLWNSPFGEMGDVICPDAGQKSEDFLATLSTYKVAILIGLFNEKKIDAQAIAAYARNGGRVYLNEGQLKMLNAKLASEGGAALVPSESVVVIPDFVDEKFRKLNITSYPEKQKMITTGQKTFPVVIDLMQKLQDELLPVTVEGDIQWGVNFVQKVGGESRSTIANRKIEKSKNSHWLVWLINNKGVKKYAREEDIIDHAFDAKVKVTDKRTGKVYEKLVPAGGWSYLQVDL